MIKRLCSCTICICESQNQTVIMAMACAKEPHVCCSAEKQQVLSLVSSVLAVEVVASIWFASTAGWGEGQELAEGQKLGTSHEVQLVGFPTLVNWLYLDWEPELVALLAALRP